MKAEDQKEKKVQNSQTIDKVRRSFSRAGVFAPVLLTLNSKTALGSTYQCVISGMQSGNVSGQSEDMTVCASGYTADDWLGVDNASTNTGNAAAVYPNSPNIINCINAGFIPFRVLKRQQGNNSISYQYEKNSSCPFNTTLTANQIAMCSKIFSTYSALAENLSAADCGLSLPSGNNSSLKSIAATTFESVFVGSGVIGSIWDKLAGSGLEYHASVNYLNAKLGLIPDISPQEVVALYNLAKNGTAFMDGSLSVSNQAGAAELLASLHP